MLRLVGLRFSLVDMPLRRRPFSPTLFANTLFANRPGGGGRSLRFMHVLLRGAILGSSFKTAAGRGPFHFAPRFAARFPLR